MASRRAVGTFLQRAARGAGLAAEEWRLGTCASVCSVDAVTGVTPGTITWPAPSTSQHASSQPAMPLAQAARSGVGGLASVSPAGSAGFSTFATAAASSPSPSPSDSEAAGAAAVQPTDGAAGAEGDAGSAASASSSAPSAELLVRRGQLLDSLAACLGIHQLDALLASERNRAVFDEMLLVTALDTAHRLYGSSASAAVPVPSLSSPSSSGAAPHKSAADAATDVLTRLSELLIQLLSEPGALSTEGAVRALRTLAVLRFNPAGDRAGLMTMSAFYRETVLPALDPARSPPPELALRAPLLLVDLYFAFSRLFEVAARRDRELQAQLQAQQARDEEAAARAAADEEASASYSPPPPPPPPAPLEVDLGDKQLYAELDRLLVAHGMLNNLPSKSLGMLASAISASGHYNFHLADALGRTTTRRLAAAAGGGVEAGGVLGSGGGDAMAASTLSNIVHALGKVRHPDDALYDTAAQWMLQRMQGAAASSSGGAGGGGGGRAGGVEPHHLVDVAVAFARVKYDSIDYLQRASEVMMGRMSHAGPNAVSMMAWALANSQCGRSARFEPLLSALCARMVALWQRSRARSLGLTLGPRPAAYPPTSAAAAAPSASVLPRHLACIAFAAGRLDMRPPALPALLDAVAADVEARPEEYQARQLANVLVAFRRLQSYRPGLFSTACAVLRSRLEALAPHGWEAAAQPALFGPSHVFGPQNYADAAWAVATAGHAGEEAELMALLAERVIETSGNLGKACLVRAAQAFAVAEMPDPRVFDALAKAAAPRLMELGPPYQAMLIDAFAEVAHPVTEEFWLACMDAVGVKLPHLQARADRPDMQAAAAQLAAAFRRHPATAAFPRCREHSVLALLAELEAGAGLGA